MVYAGAPPLYGKYHFGLGVRTAHLYKPSFHFIVHVLFHVILHYCLCIVRQSMEIKKLQELRHDAQLTRADFCADGSLVRPRAPMVKGLWGVSGLRF